MHSVLLARYIIRMADTPSGWGKDLLFFSNFLAHGKSTHVVL